MPESVHCVPVAEGVVTRPRSHMEISNFNSPEGLRQATRWPDGRRRSISGPS